MVGLTCSEAEMNDILTNPEYQMPDKEYAERDRKLKAFVRAWQLLMFIFGVFTLALTIYIVVHAQGQPHLVRQVCYYSDKSHHDC